MNERPRLTLAEPSAIFRGVGLHSGADAAVRFLPASSESGLIFRNKENGQEITALAANVSDTSRCTRLSAGGYELQTVEHVLSALTGLGVDDAVIEFEGSEMPAADGSAAPFVSLIQNAGLREQAFGVAHPLILPQTATLSEGASTIVALPADRFRAAVVLDYPKHSYLGTMAAVFDSVQDDFAAEIAPARTFGFLSEIEALQVRGLGLGASRENAVVLGEEGYETSLRFPNELARHKLLDLIGDLALLGRPLQAQIIAVRPSHTLNTRLAQTLAQRQ